MAETTKKLVRSRSNRMLAGICGGLGHYFGLDPVLFRILFVVLMVLDGAGLLLYIVLWILIPEENVIKAEGQQVEQVTDNNTASEAKPSVQRNQWQNIIGVVVIIIGLSFLSRQFFAITWLQWHLIWPITFILLGIFIIMKRR